MLISPGSTCFVSSSNIDQDGGGGGALGAKRELLFHTRDRSLVQKQSFLNNFVQDCIWYKLSNICLYESVNTLICL